MKKFIGGFLLVMLCSSGMLGQEERTAASLYNEGLGLLKEKKYEEGLPLLEEAITKATESNDEKVISLAKKNAAIATYNVGNIKRKAGNLDEALALYQKGVEFMPEKSSNYSGIATVLAKQGKKKEAMMKYLEAADVATKAEKTKRAKKFLKKASNIVGKEYVGKNYDTALEFGKIFLESSQDANVNYYVSQSYSNKEMFDEALAHAEKAVELSADKPEDKYYVAKANALEGKGDKAAAVEAYKLVTGEKYKKMAEGKIQLLQGS